MSRLSTRQDVNGFIADLERELREKKLTLLDSEILAAVESKQATREQICEWAKFFYASTRHGRMSIGNFYANAPDDDELRRELAENIYEEETGRISGVGMCQMQVFQFLLDAFGISGEAAKKLPAPIGNHMPQGSPIPPHEFCVTLSTYGFSIEIPNAEWSARMARALQENYGLSDQAVRWFTMHAALDALAFAPVAKHIWNGHGAWQSLASSNERRARRWRSASR